MQGEELEVANLYPGLAREQGDDRYQPAQRLAQREERIPGLGKDELGPQVRRQRPPVTGEEVEQDLGQGPRPLVLLNHGVGETRRAITDGDRVRAENAARPVRVEPQGVVVVLRQRVLKAADRAQRRDAERCVGSDDERGVTAVVAHLQRSVQGRLHLVASADHPGVGLVCAGDGWGAPRTRCCRRESCSIATERGPTFRCSSPPSACPCLRGGRLSYYGFWPAPGGTLAGLETRPSTVSEASTRRYRLPPLVPAGQWPWLGWAQWLDAMDMSGLQSTGAARYSHYDQMIEAAIQGEGVAHQRVEEAGGYDVIHRDVSWQGM